MLLFNKISAFWNNPDQRMRKVNRNIVYSLGVKGAGILVSLMMVPVTLRYLSEYEYGIWLTIFSILNWINYFDMGLGNGLRNKLAECVAQNYMRQGRIYVSSALAFLSAIALVLCFIMLLISHYVDWNSFLNIDQSVIGLRHIIDIMVVCVCANFVLKTVGVIHMSFQNVWINNLLTFLGSFLAFIWICILCNTTEPSLMKVAVAMSISPIIVYLLAYPVTFFFKYKSLSPNIKYVRLKESISLGGLGIKFFFLQLACLIIFSTSNIIISRLFSPGDVTPYNIAYKYFNVLSLVFMIIINPIWTAITDAYTRKDYLWISKSINRMISIWGIAIVGLAIMTFVSKFMFKLWVGNDIVIPYSLCGAVAIFMAISMWTNIFSSYVNGVGHLSKALLTMSLSAVVFIPLSVLLSRIIGITGVPYAMSLSMLIPGIALALQYRNEMNNMFNNTIDNHKSSQG